MHNFEYAMNLSISVLTIFFFLGQLWAPQFLLHASYWPSNIENLLPLIKNTSKHIKFLSLDRGLFEILENILLCRADLLQQVDQAALACSLLQTAVDNLVMKTATDKKKFIQIFMAALTLFTPSAFILHSLLFKPIIGLIPIETVIATI